MGETFQTVLDVVSRGLFILAGVAGAICLVDWAIRTRRISPFSGTARFFRRRVDPLLEPIETMVVRRGGMPAQAPFYAFMAVVVLGIVLITVLRLLYGVAMQVTVGVSSPGRFAMMLIGWGFDFLTFALIVRVISSWLPVSPYSKWIRWSYVCTEWILAPLRRVIPAFSGIDITPIVAYLILRVAGAILGV